ncbi:MAG: hypothetical protein JJ992_17210, partial [Planctomycetes bacterium]|nr:hypothetical protein [Planctomycetota bacterium]
MRKRPTTRNLRLNATGLLVASVLFFTTSDLFGQDGSYKFSANNDAGRRILSTDFREMLADEGWEAASEATRVEQIEVADDPAEYGVQIRNGAILGSKCEVLPHHYYRLRFRAKTLQRAHWAATFITKDGHEIVADVYDAVDASPDWQSYTFMFRAHPDARHVRIRLQPDYTHIDVAPLSVRNLRVDEVCAAEVAQWADEVVSVCPLVHFEPAADRWQQLPRTMQRLREGGKLRIVMLGDSICNDTSNALYETQLVRLYPEANIEVVTSVRGGTGCWYYKEDERVQDYVLDYDPDLVVIAGISHHFDPESIRSVIQQIRQKSDCEILVMTGAVTPERTMQRAHLKSKPISEAMWEMEQFTRRMRRMCREENAEFFDIRRAWGDYMLRSLVGLAERGVSA